MTRFFFVFFSLLLAGCASPDAGPPPVDLDKLAPLLADLQVADALATEIPVLVRDSIRQVYFDRVLADYGTDRDGFDSLTWIVRQEPAWIDSLYEKVNVILMKIEAKEE